MKPKTLLAWVLAAALSAACFVWAFHRVEAFAPEAWRIDHSQAEAIALEQGDGLGDLPDPPFVIVTKWEEDLLLLRMHDAIRDGAPLERLRGSRLADQLHSWRATIYDRQATQGRWSHRVRVSPTGKILQLERQMADDEPAGVLDPQEGREVADALLEVHGFDLALYGEPAVRVVDRENRSDTTFRYVDPESILGAAIVYGVEAKFAGDQLVGFETFVDDPDEESLSARFQSGGLWQQVWIFLPILLVPFVAIPFVRRYHAGEIGVRRGLKIGVAVLVGGVLSVLFTAKGIAATSSFGLMTKPQVALAIIIQFSVVFYFPMAVLAFLTWSVGESLCREHWAHKLAGIDALFRGAWNNATFARASLRGVASGLAILAATGFLLLLLPDRWTVLGGLGTGGPGWTSVQWVFIPALGFALGYSLYSALFGQLFLVPWLARRFGRWGGPVAAALLSGAMFFPPAIVLPFSATYLISCLVYGACILVFLRYGAFAGVMAVVTVNVFPMAVRLFDGGTQSMELNGALMVLAMMLPVALSLKHILSSREFVYRYEDVPMHVRKIAERERQKVELETARGIQSSILPELPPELNGVRLAHSYLPASEVGGDFYDVMALDDGRLAIAVGDVAGHGVSSGLVMSMAKSALAVQVTFDPEVEPVFRTLNRMVYQSARRRLLTTLCYALVDPVRKEMSFASAGHLFPYRVTATGAVEALESISYPLGVRDTLAIRPRAARFEGGDKLFLYSDGVVEANPENSAEQFGFERLESSLEQHATADVMGLRDGVLADLAKFVGRRPLEDDLTVLVLGLPG